MRLDRVAVAVGPVEAERRSPVVKDEGHVLGRSYGLEPGVEVAAVLYEAIRARSGVRQLVGVAHPEEVGRQATPQGRQVRDHRPPEERRGWVAVQEHDRVGRPLFHEGDPPPQNLHCAFVHSPLLLVLRSPIIMTTLRARRP